MNRNILRGAIIGTVAAGVALGSVSMAAWSVNGGKNENTKASRSIALDVAVTGADVETGAYPTGSDDITINVVNPNKFKVTMNSLSVQVVVNTTAGGYAQACLDALRSQAGQATISVTGIPQALPTLARETGSASFPVNIAFSNDFPQSCEGAPLFYSVNAAGSSSN